MVSDDLGFLLIFIVLPTVLIVSGFWMVLFIRRDVSSRPSVQRAPRPEPVLEEPPQSREDAWAAALDESGDESPASTAADEFPLVIATLPTREVDSESPAPVETIAVIDRERRAPLQGADALSAALLQDRERHSEAPAVSDEALIELVDEDDRETLIEELDTPHDDEAARPSGNTEQIVPVGEMKPVEPNADEGATAPAPSDHLDADELEPSRDEEAMAGHTAPLPDAVADEPEPEGQDEGEPQADEPTTDDGGQRRRQRQPDARLTRSTKHVRKRGRAGARRIPPIVRPGLRDEDAVERKDGG